MLQIITNCPSCASALERVNDQLFCRDKGCPAQNTKKVEKYAKQLKIKGLGPATIEKLNIENIGSMYMLQNDYIIATIGEALGTKLILEIEKSLRTTVEDLLPAFSIPLIGKTASSKLSAVIGDIKDIGHKACKDAGLGEKATSNLLKWVDLEYEDIGYVFIKRSAPKQNLGTVCITGKLDGFTRSSASLLLKEKGFTVTTSVSKNTDILLNGGGKASAKTTKAQTLGIKIIDNIEELLNVIT